MVISRYEIKIQTSDRLELKQERSAHVSLGSSQFADVVA